MNVPIENGTPAPLHAALAMAGAIGEEPAPERRLDDLPAWARRRLQALEDANRALAERLLVAERLAQYDDISGLPNHRAATTLLERTIRRHGRDHRSFALLFIDGDNLRLYNEESYEAGNRMIARLAQTLQHSLRPSDHVARWLSGDEFLAILPDTTAPQAGAAAERLRSTVERVFRSAHIPVTISIGVASFPDDGKTADTLIAAAVASNAAAKRAGKNCVVALGDGR